MYVQIIPSEHDMSDTLSSLDFVTRVRGVELGQAKKHIDSSELHKLTSSLYKAKQDLRRKEDAIKKLEKNYQSLEVKIKCKDQMHKSQPDQVGDVTGQLELKAQLRKQLEKQTSQRSDEVKEKQDMCSTERSKVAPSEQKTWSNHVLPCRPPGIMLVESKFRKRLRIWDPRIKIF
ncbi:kinesin-like protein KIN-14R [Tanacetum coccineum]